MARRGETLKACTEQLHSPNQQHCISKKRKRREPFLKAILGYLRSDSYMYGPLLSSYPSKWRLASKSQLHTAKGTGILGLSSPFRGITSRPNMVTSTSVRPVEVVTEETRNYIHFSSITKEYNKEQMSDQPGPRNVIQDGKEQILDGSLHENMFQDGKSSEDFEENETPVKTEAFRNTPSYSATESYSTDGEFVPLDKDMAEEVVQCLVKKLGGRYSKELGIYVDICDSEVERWFLAASLLTNPHSFEKCKQIFKNLQGKGIFKLIDILGMDQDQLAGLIEVEGLTIHKYRIASRLLRLAKELNGRFSGHICSLKHIESYLELKHQLQLLPGISFSASHAFLRELKGVWPGANPELDRKTRNAAKHLRLILDTHSDIWIAIKNLSQAAGLDARDVELALFKLGLEHVRQYPYCLGGSVCMFLRTPMPNLSS